MGASGSGCSLETETLLIAKFFSGFFGCCFSLRPARREMTQLFGKIAQNKKHFQPVISSLIPSQWFGLKKTKQVVLFASCLSLASCQWFTSDWCDNQNPFIHEQLIVWSCCQNAWEDKIDISQCCKVDPTFGLQCKLTWLLSECLVACVSWSVKPNYFLMVFNAGKLAGLLLNRQLKMPFTASLRKAQMWQPVKWELCWPACLFPTAPLPPPVLTQFPAGLEVPRPGILSPD